MKAAYMKIPFKFKVEEVPIREPDDNEVVLNIKACGVCGFDLICAASKSQDWQPFGHEISGVVERVGEDVTNVVPGDRVVVESCGFDRYSNAARNGRSDLDNNVPLVSSPDKTMGFAEYMTVPAQLCVKFNDIDFESAALIEPFGVAVDVVQVADIKLNDDVLVLGLGPIGNMILKLARLMGARNVFGAEFSDASKRIEMAKNFGADDIILTDKIKLSEYKFPRGGVDRIIVTAPPKAIPSSLDVANKGAVITFIGIEYGKGAEVSFDFNYFHFNKLQLRASHASPAMYFPKCIDLVEKKIVDLSPLITHTFRLDEIDEAINSFKNDRKNAIKAVMVNK